MANHLRSQSGIIPSMFLATLLCSKLCRMIGFQAYSYITVEPVQLHTLGATKSVLIIIYFCVATDFYLG